MNFGVTYGSGARRKIDDFSAVDNSELAVLADYDYTMTKKWGGGIVLPNSWGIPRLPDLRERLFEQTERLFHVYYPQEHDPGISPERRVEIVTEWEKKVIALYKEAGVGEEHMHELARLLPLRDGCHDLVSLTSSRAVPFCVCSAGIHEVIASSLDRIELLTEHVSIVANRMVFDGRGRVSGSVVKLHSLQKSWIWSRDLLPATVADRSKVVVIGDSIGDAHMAHDDGGREFLTIGLCNDGDEKVRRRYLDAFDIVIFGDGGLEPVNAILQQILG